MYVCRMKYKYSYSINVQDRVWVRVQRGKVDFDRTPHTGANGRPFKVYIRHTLFFVCSCPIIQYNTIQYSYHQSIPITKYPKSS